MQLSSAVENLLADEQLQSRSHFQTPDSNQKTFRPSPEVWAFLNGQVKLRPSGKLILSASSLTCVRFCEQSPNLCSLVRCSSGQTNLMLFSSCSAAVNIIRAFKDCQAVRRQAMSRNDDYLTTSQTTIEPLSPCRCHATLISNDRWLPP